MPSIAETATIVNQAIRVGSCGNSLLRARLEAQRNHIAAIFCASGTQASSMNQRELYLRVLLEVLKIALIQSTKLVDFTEAREDASRDSSQQSNSSRIGDSKDQKQSNSSMTMRGCQFRSWDRHRKGDDESNSNAASNSRANSYLFYRDASINKNASGEEGITENDQRSEMSQLGIGTTDGERTSQRISHIKPRPDSELGLVPPVPDTAEPLEGCNPTDAWSVSVGTVLGIPGIISLLSCFQQATAFVVGNDTLGGKYEATSILESSNFTKTPPGSGGIVGSCSTTPACAPDVSQDLCSESGGALWEAQVNALPETFSNEYSGSLVFEFSASIHALGTGVGISGRFNLQAGEAYSQSAKIDASYDHSTSRTIYCSDGGTLSAQKGRTESFAQSVGQQKNDKHRRTEKASEASSTLNATSIGTMRFSGKSTTNSDRNATRTVNGISSKIAKVEELSTAILADVSGMKMRSITEYRHQITKMLDDLMKKTQEQIEELHLNKQRSQGVESSSVDIAARCDTPMAKIGYLYRRPTIRGKYPLFSATGKI